MGACYALMVDHVLFDSRGMTKQEEPNPAPLTPDASARQGVRRNVIGWVAAVALYSLAIIHFGTRSRVEFVVSEILSHDKILHAMVFGGLGVLGYRCNRALAPQRGRKWAGWIAVGFATSVGLLLELIQSQLPYRSAEVADLVADFCGAALSVALLARRG